MRLLAPVRLHSRAVAAAALLPLLLVVGAAPASARAEAAPKAVAALLQEGSKITAEAGATQRAFGFSVAISGDGDTALIGARRNNGSAGAAWVFTRTDGVWAQQGAALSGAAEPGAHTSGRCESATSEFRECGFGRSVALSADGDTALIGTTFERGKRGAVLVFIRSGSTWSQQGQALLAGEEGPAGKFGDSVALSSDGNTALVGGATDDEGDGAAWVFTRSGSTWDQQGPKLSGGGESGAGNFGRSVAMSGDGNTALIGGPADDGERGSLWAFTRNGSNWTQIGPKFTGAEEKGAAGIGMSVALSADGTTALAGGGADNGGIGAAWAFSRSGAGFTQQGPKLTGVGESGPGAFGVSVALSGDGLEALIGAPEDGRRLGAAWNFARSGSTWGERGELTGEGELRKGAYGTSVALSETGASALVGGSRDNRRAGAAWAYLDPTIAPAGEESPPPVVPGPAAPLGTAITLISGGGVLGNSTLVVPPPKLGLSGNVEPVSGTVRVKLPGSNVFVTLTGLRQIPFGTIIDARHGRVTVTTQAADGAIQTITFYEGEFKLTQNRHGLVIATLFGGGFAGCPTARERSHLASASSKHVPPKHVVRKLWASGHGSYETKGNYASGAVLGTRWLTEDRCDGTLIRVATDKVAVTNLITHRRKTVMAGASYFAKAP